MIPTHHCIQRILPQIHSVSTYIHHTSVTTSSEHHHSLIPQPTQHKPLIPQRLVRRPLVRCRSKSHPATQPTLICRGPRDFARRQEEPIQNRMWLAVCREPSAWHSGQLGEGRVCFHGNDGAGGESEAAVVGAAGMHVDNSEAGSVVCGNFGVVDELEGSQETARVVTVPVGEVDVFDGLEGSPETR